MVTVRGELDLYTAPQLRDLVVGLDEQGEHRLVLDLQDVGFVDSTGLGVIVACLKRCREHGGELTLVAPERSAITKLLSLTGLGDALPVVGDLDAALGR